MVACLAAGVDAAGVLADAYAIGVKLARDPAASIVCSASRVA